ncbi:MAG: mechanosensitive ion channel family protein [Bacteroidetes bacterium]|nr:MAG: mechanosensitive ion channel family protein [Bacteroidota bacterium]
MFRKLNFTLFLLAFITSTLFTQTIDTTNTTVKHSDEQDAFVVFQGDSLFKINTGLGPFSPTKRAEQISGRLESIAKDITMVQDSFFISEEGGYTLISYKETIIMSISNADAEVLGLPKQKIAINYIGTIKQSFINHIENKSLSDWLINIGYTILTLIGLAIILMLIKISFKWINKKLLKYEKGLKRKRKSFFRYLAPDGPQYFFIFLSNIVKIGLIILILFLYLPLLFRFMPGTKGLVNQFYSYIADPVNFILNGLISFLPNLFYIAIIVIITRYVLRILNYVAQEIEEEKLKLKGFHKDWAHPTLNIVKIIIYAFSIVFMFPYLPGSSSPAFQGVTIFLGVLFSFGSTSAIANIIAGIVITYMRPFTIGDRVMINGVAGDVVEKTLLVTRLRTIKNEDITIPNATIINTHLWNYSKNAKKLGLILHPTVTIGYDVPSQTVIKLLLEAAKNTKNLTREFKPFVLQKSLNDFYVEYELNVYTKQPSKMAFFISELNKSIQEEFNKAGVEILSPHYQAMRDGNSSTISGEATDMRNPVDKIIDKFTGKDQE